MGKRKSLAHVNWDMFDNVQSRINYKGGKNRKLNKPKCLLIGKWINKVSYCHRTHTVKMNEQQLYTHTHTHTHKTWIHFTNIGLSRKRKSWDICNLISPI